MVLHGLKYNLLIFFIFLNVSFGCSQTYNGTIIRVIDGDTYVFQTEEGSFTVRMSGTDAPERDQPFAKESMAFLEQYLYKDAIMKIKGTDRYGRRLGVLMVDGKDINLLSVKGGYAWHFKRYSSDPRYVAAEKSARRKKSGLWKLPNPVPPWNWRNKQHQKTITSHKILDNNNTGVKFAFFRMFKRSTLEKELLSRL